ncbi:MAG: helix-turn-helix domain-containing protein [Candidatus Aminicenantes bacterium]|nr:helix-turn-helix domain-containing protein [Candidatus Aminicenantes bacterium]
MNQFIRFPIQIISSGIIEFMHTSHFRVYACLDSHKDRKSQAFPSLETIRTKTKLNRHTIQRAIKDLIEWGLIKKAHVKREKGRGYRTIYTIIQEPSLKNPHKKIKKKIFCSAKRKRDLKGRFTDVKQPHQRTVLNRLKQPSNMAVNHPNKSKQPHMISDNHTTRTTTNKIPVFFRGLVDYPGQGGLDGNRSTSEEINGT